MGAEDGERRAQLVGGIGGELALAAEALIQAIEGAVDGGDQRLQLARQSLLRQPVMWFRWA